MAEDYYPKVINNITVGGVQQVMLHVQVMEVSRRKLRALGFDWTNFGSSDFVSQHISGLIREVASNSGTVSGTGNSTITFGLIGPNNRFFGFVEALRQYDLVKVLAEPVLTTVSGRPASFNAGGEFPILIPQGLGTVAIEFKQFGTRVDFVPIVLGNGNIRLEVRPQVSEIDSARGVDLNGTRIPGLRTRWVDTAVEMRSGQTLALAGLIQNRVEAQNRGIPWLADLPWAGSLFRRVEEASNEIELLVMVRPELVDALDPHQVPACGPGEQTTSPNDVELYFRGYLEVPDCCKDGTCARCRPGVGVYGVPNVSLERGPTGGGEGDAAPTAEGTEYLPDAVEPPIAPPVFRGSEYRHRAQPTAEQRLLSASLLVASEPLPSPQETVRVVCFMTDSSGDRSSHDRRGGLVPVSESTLIDHEPRLFGQVGYDVLD
jgi:pilus assembly protein CpaC